MGRAGAFESVRCPLGSSAMSLERARSLGSALVQPNKTAEDSEACMSDGVAIDAVVDGNGIGSMHDQQTAG